MNLKKITATAASLLALSAGATTTDWGAHDPLEVGVGLVNPGSFADAFLFNLSAASSLISTTVANNLGGGGVLSIADGTVQLYKEAGAVDQLIDSYSFDGTTGNTTHTFASLMAGDYYYKVSGKANGASGGFYATTSSTSPVPEPESYALLLAGLAVGGLIYRRRIS